ncbi:CBM35 domain-containing protein [Kitasatospora sp. NBC_01539]|uniref:CBM35 domain-containing protein n=1 Tax=Kitasatospora sp. NBC_01539 TaxID=2903577 RepID=UPI0038602B6C
MNLRRARLLRTAVTLTALTAAAALPLPGTGPQRAHAADTVAVPEVITVDTGRQSGPLTKAGLGTLFGVASVPATPKDLVAQSQVFLSQHQSLAGDAHYPTSTEAVTGTLQGTGVKMIARFNDLMGGWPYEWKSMDQWLGQVRSGMQSLAAYRSQIYAVVPLNEPDNKLQGAFMTDPGLPAGSYDSKVNYLWTQTVRTIRSIDPTIRVMGPNYEHYNPWESADRQPRMRAFLVNSMNTGTVPDAIGWHSLGPSPGDVPAALTSYYRPLEQELHLPGAPKPIVIEEYGPGSGDFEGVPGTMVKHWAEFARYGIDYATMGVYTNPGLLGNSLRRTYGAAPRPNGGFWFMSWFKSMQGNGLAVSRWDTRHYQAADAVASWDQAARTVTVLAGGEDADVDVKVQGLAARGLGPNVRVRVEYTRWSKDPNEADPTVEAGGDPESGPHVLVDRTATLDADGDLTVPIHRMDRYDGYRITVSPPAAAVADPTVYEAEAAQRTHAVLHGGSDGVLASGGAYVGGLDHADSALAFAVDAPKAGLYTMTVRYAAGVGDATHTVTVGGRPQGQVAYPATTGWAPAQLRTATRRVLLAAGRNTVTLGHGTGYAEVDRIEVRPDTHRYEAESATVTDARRSVFPYDYVPGYVGGLDSATSAVEFAVDAPADGTYRLDVGYANGTAATSSHHVSVDGAAQGDTAYPPTGSWLGTPQQDRPERLSSITVHLHPGINRVRLQKAVGFAELDFLTVSPA